MDISARLVDESKNSKERETGVLGLGIDGDSDWARKLLTLFGAIQANSITTKDKFGNDEIVGSATIEIFLRVAVLGEVKVGHRVLFEHSADIKAMALAKALLAAKGHLSGFVLE